MSNPPEVRIGLPDWTREIVDWDRRYASDEDKMRLVIDLSRENILRAPGGPLGPPCSSGRAEAWSPWA